MPDNHIAAALRAAAQFNCYGGIDGDNCDQCVSAVHCRCPGHYLKATAAAVAAFLRALPDHAAGWYGHELAAAVEQEARNDR